MNPFVMQEVIDLVIDTSQKLGQPHCKISKSAWTQYE
jgi:hypothetical protein